ncbi:MAG: carbonic anhydrase [Proteobacteria bacterium]|nr:carbonic anhydrase [Pseudomonadota bacterium]
MNGLTDGVRQFQSEVYPAMRERFSELAGGQAPPTLFVTCSDSRVDPSLITQQGPGELFVLRNAGNFVTPYGTDGGVDSAVEYAVAVLKVERVVVCGHAGCGAVGGALAPDKLDAVPAVQKWVGHARAAVDATAHLAGDERLPAAVASNVGHQIENLRGHPCVAAALEAGSLELVGWVYDIASGGVDAVDSGGGVA